jgi:hypothetical protein
MDCGSARFAVCFDPEQRFLSEHEDRRFSCEMRRDYGRAGLHRARAIRNRGNAGAGRVHGA